MSNWSDYKSTPPHFANGALVRVKGRPIEQAHLYGREVAGPFARGVITRPARRSLGRNRYLVHFAAHTYFSPVKQQKSMIPALDIVIREDHLEEVEMRIADVSAQEPIAVVPVEVEAVGPMSNWSQPLLLDLFCGAGGAGEGYARAGFHVVGCDLDPKPLRHNPHEAYQGDALVVLDTLLDGGTWHGYGLSDFAAIHASPMCQGYTRGRHLRPRANRTPYPLLIGPVRARLARVAMPWVIENVEDAYPEMPDAVMLCGTMFGLRVWRHRLFASNRLLFAAAGCNHYSGCISVRRKRSEYIGSCSGVTYLDRQGRTRKRPIAAHAAACAAMGIDWMNSNELGEAIPPAYTEWLGRQLLTVIHAPVREEAFA